MHDPLTVAWEIKRPWRDKPSQFFKEGYRPAMITVWHKDPERDGSDDSCGWFSPRLTKAELARCKELIRNPHDNIGHFFTETHDSGKEWQLAITWRALKRFNRPWWAHPRYHFWHYRIQVHFIQALKRFLFSRCKVCGGRFGWNESPYSTGWGGDGPRWFRSERGVYHGRCDGIKVESR